VTPDEQAIANVKLITPALEELKKMMEWRDKAYAERDALVCVLSKLWPSHLMLHDIKDVDWDREWMTIVCINSPVGQLTWHIHVSEVPMFAHLKKRPNDWDGHTTEEKYARLARLENA
jgi:hypothetical protein